MAQNIDVARPQQHYTRADFTALRAWLNKLPLEQIGYLYYTEDDLESLGCETPVALRDPGDIVARHYLRFSLKDQPGTLARVAAVLGDHGIGIDSVMQKEARSGEHVPVIVVTHGGLEKQFQAAISEIDRLDVVGAPTVRLRIEDFN